MAVDHVVHISVDGLSATLLEPLVEEELRGDAGLYATYARLHREGAVTYNARTDFSHTNTLPNHTTMVTGRPVLKPAHQPETVPHFWTSNTDPSRGQTLHNTHPALDYVASTFDVVHDAGLSTALFASKSKFSLFEVSYDARHGAPDTNPAGGDNGRNKIDFVRIESDTSSLVDAFTETLAENNVHYSFVHLRDPDSVGHGSGWGSDEWQQAVRHTDRLIGQMVQSIENDSDLRNNTAVIVTSDHGGTGNGHGDPANVRNYRIPFFVWGPGIAAGEDVYRAYASNTVDPGSGRPDYDAPGQPVRNGDSGNLALDLLDLSTIPGSVIRSLVQDASAGDLMQVRLEVTDSDGEPASIVYVGTELTLTAYVRDMRHPPAGVSAAYVDVRYPSQLVASDGPIEYGPGFDDGQSGVTVSAGLLDEVGARRGGGSPAVHGDELFRASFRALETGDVQFEADPADDPDRVMMLSGRAAAVPDDQVRFDDAAVQIISYHNREMPMDVNGDRLVSPSDVLSIVNDVNNVGAGRLVDLYPLLGPDNQRVDVNRDGILSPLDALIVINYLNTRATAARTADETARNGNAGIDLWFAESADFMREDTAPAIEWASRSPVHSPREALFATHARFNVPRTATPEASNGYVRNASQSSISGGDELVILEVDRPDMVGVRAGVHLHESQR